MLRTPGDHGSRADLAGARHRRQHGHLQLSRCHDAALASGQGSAATGQTRRRRIGTASPTSFASTELYSYPFYRQFQQKERRLLRHRGHLQHDEQRSRLRRRPPGAGVDPCSDRIGHLLSDPGRRRSDGPRAQRRRRLERRRPSRCGHQRWFLEAHVRRRSLDSEPQAETGQNRLRHRGRRAGRVLRHQGRRSSRCLGAVIHGPGHSSRLGQVQGELFRIALHHRPAETRREHGAGHGQHQLFCFRRYCTAFPMPSFPRRM